MPNTAHVTDVNVPVTVTTAVDSTEKTRKYLMNRVEDARFNKMDKARHTFHIVEDVRPASPAEMVKRLMEGKFRYDDRCVKEDGTWRPGHEWCNPLEGISWRTVDPDKDGFEKWAETDNDARKKAKDEIMVFAPKEALESLRAYEALN